MGLSNRKCWMDCKKYSHRGNSTRIQRYLCVNEWLWKGKEQNVTKGEGREGKWYCRLVLWLTFFFSNRVLSKLLVLLSLCLRILVMAIHQTMHSSFGDSYDEIRTRSTSPTDRSPYWAWATQTTAISTTPSNELKRSVRNLVPLSFMKRVLLMMLKGKQGSQWYSLRYWSLFNVLTLLLYLFF